MSGKLQRKNEANINWKNRDALKENVYVQQFLTVQQFFIEYGLWIRNSLDSGLTGWTTTKESQSTQISSTKDWMCNHFLYCNCQLIFSLTAVKLEYFFQIQDYILGGGKLESDCVWCDL